MILGYSYCEFVKLMYMKHNVSPVVVLAIHVYQRDAISRFHGGNGFLRNVFSILRDHVFSEISVHSHIASSPNRAA